MPDQSAEGEDDWVKQMLAEAMLGRSTLPPVSQDQPVAAAEDNLDADADEPEVRYQVVLDEPASLEPVDEAIGEVVDVTEPALDESIVEATAPDVQYEVILDEPELDVAEPDESEAAEPVLETVDLVEETTEVPAPASTSRLFDRPSFDATNDPGVNEMLEAELSHAESRSPVEDRSQLRGVLEWIVVLGSAVIVALLLRAFLFQAFFIPSESMEATLQVDDRVLVNKLSYRIGDVSRGEVVVFRRPDDQPGEFRDLIKRVIGLPGESIEARDNTIFIDGQVLIEPYLTPGEAIGDFGPVVIPEREYFVMGDNRDNSGDSRVFGPIDEDRFIGRAFFLFWPLDRIGSL